jgi:hypothetical protein
MLVNLFNIAMPNQVKVEEAIGKKFVSKEKFAEAIEHFVQETRLSYIDAIVEYCERNNIEVESVSKLISKPLKEKLRYEASELNYLKKTSLAKLPL